VNTKGQLCTITLIQSVFKGLAVERVQLRGRTGMKTTSSRERVSLSASPFIYARACIVNDVNVLQLIVLRAARVAYSLCDGSIGNGRLGTALDVGGRRRSGIRSEGCSQKHCAGKEV